MLYWNFDARRRHPLTRLVAAILGGAALVVVIAFGMFAAAALVVGGAVLLLVNALRAPRHASAAGSPTSAPPGVIEGEFTVIRDAREKSR